MSPLYGCLYCLAVLQRDSYIRHVSSTEGLAALAAAVVRNASSVLKVGSQAVLPVLQAALLGSMMRIGQCCCSPSHGHPCSAPARLPTEHSLTPEHSLTQSFFLSSPAIPAFFPQDISNGDMSVILKLGELERMVLWQAAVAGGCWGGWDGQELSGRLAGWAGRQAGQAAVAGGWG